MKCKEAIELMSDAVEQALGDRAESAFDRHLAACRHCGLYLAQVRLTIAVAASLGEISKPSPDLSRTLLARASA